MPEEPVHAAFDERVTRRGQRHVAEPAVGVRPAAADQALAFGPGHPLGDGAGADQALPGLTLGSEFFQGTLTEERKQRLIAETRTGRPGTTADIAAVVTFLASPSAGHLTGQVIHVNGGAYLGL